MLKSIQRFCELAARVLDEHSGIESISVENSIYEKNDGSDITEYTVFKYVGDLGQACFDSIEEIIILRKERERLSSDFRSGEIIDEIYISISRDGVKMNITTFLDVEHIFIWPNSRAVRQNTCQYTGRITLNFDKVKSGHEVLGLAGLSGSLEDFNKNIHNRSLINAIGYNNQENMWPLYLVTMPKDTHVSVSINRNEKNSGEATGLTADFICPFGACACFKEEDND